jgi:transposase
MEQTLFIHPILEQSDMPPSLPVFVGLDYSQHAIQLCVLDAQRKVLCNRPVDDAADEIRTVEQRLAKVTAGDATIGWPLTLKGIGPVTAWTLRAEIGRFDRFRSGKQLARYCGLTPCNRSSGERQADAGLIRAANPELRHVLIEAAWLLARLEPRWQKLALRLKAHGKPSTVVIAAVANRFVRWLYHEGVRQQAAG